MTLEGKFLILDGEGTWGETQCDGQGKQAGKGKSYTSSQRGIQSDFANRIDGYWQLPGRRPNAASMPRDG